MVKGLGQTPWLAEFLEAPCARISAWTKFCRFTHIAGWGLKPSASRAREYAGKLGVPFISLEDGFLRSLGLGVDGAPLHSLIVDRSGIYYDATRPSDLETLIREQALDPIQLQRAGDCIDMLKRYRLSKYNHAPDRPPAKLETKQSNVLVVDQTAGDASIEYGLASAASFSQMLNAAVAENPGADVLVKVHPDVIAGKKQGHLLEQASALGCRLIGDDLNPWALLDLVDRVYVVTSQFGFEALLAGRTVHCFGMPFYAGWGLTSDRQASNRRSVSRSLEAVFHAAYLQYCRYINPYTGRRCGFEDTVALIADQKRARDRFAGDWDAVDFAGWKRAFIGRFLGPGAKVEWKQNASEVAAPKVLAWASKLDSDLIAHCQKGGQELWRMEDGFVRSVGLGVDLIDPLSLVMDSRGIYYDASAASDLEQMLEHDEFSPDLLQRAAALRQRLVELKLSKYNVGNQHRLSLPKDRRIVLVPGQVETDASIRTGSPKLQTNLELLQAVRECCPDAYIIYKPHPDVLEGARKGEVPGQEYFDLEVRDLAMPDLLEQVDEVHTLTSLTGFEALLRDIPVHTWGLPFYAGWGLTQDHVACPRRTRKGSLDELVAATLIQYPLYVDPDSGDQINAETAVDILQRQRQEKRKTALRTHVWRRIRKRV
ncbi:capsular polysaccharide export protein [Marinobacterium lutimaris]|uniref:Capsular polysaccharide export protein n=2 Tax=Marinobacterium lutimaris TaxID=568106 RepID=A0A1H6B211_9GAMM|nr:capsular polysaccharide export protein [Marinobacterium lutimaris]